ncbi:putative receptor-like protein kinase [Platanthera guangdongensis]|uniref:Receptor-like protein kinase n=1 Tax=Platanthera guangdongensis TaxID=2320717 RepID=A0ABR2MCK8_9ASPA
MGDDEEIAEKLIVVALWCIQWNPKDRPTMTKVVQMLLGELQDLGMPPRPFATSSISED